ncbi:PREDICTED: protein sel-1 homolog 3-like isoform X2 [Priapulus caudatus]|uniref:Protein sel-1 homolog 3-like isoform X2 n=1 Tax=Priapulus caudatus TaxID=37621 RepID=A0ABM1DS91_PRICU|nr:PREDICTED: protein sel-1 homolog 3-like isoform X2 [Priapulus caudatus]
MVVSFQANRYKIRLEDENGINYKMDHTLPQAIKFNHAEGFAAFGGTTTMPSMTGYITYGKIYLRRVIRWDEPSQKATDGRKHFMAAREELDNSCRSDTKELLALTRKYTALLDRWKQKRSCAKGFISYIHSTRDRSNNPVCRLYADLKHHKLDRLHSVLKSHVATSGFVDRYILAGRLRQNVSQDIQERGLAALQDAFALLRAASCWNDTEAGYMLYALTTAGIATKRNINKANQYLYRGVMQGDRYSLMALANKYYYSLDGFPTDIEVAFGYFYYVAYMSQADRDLHSSSHVSVEHIRLIDEAMLAAQVDEGSDWYMWLIHQAQRGVVNASQDLARFYYWGTNGLRRNMQAALEYYKKAAQTKDPEALYNYGILHMKGHGTKKDLGKAMGYIAESAAHGNPAALATIGWHALINEKNMTKAAAYLQKATKMGNPEAANNLGYMYDAGLIPGHPASKVIAYHYYRISAVGGNLDAGINTLPCYMLGSPVEERNPQLAADWARYVAEQTPSIGVQLRTALDAFRSHNWEASLIYYILLAEMGLEVGNFNSAYLCEQHQEDVVRVMTRDCSIRHFNLSISRPLDQVSAYGKRNMTEAIRLYSEAAMKGEPQGYYNLAQMVETGTNISKAAWKYLNMPLDAHDQHYAALKELYTRCRDTKTDEAFFVCSLSLYRVTTAEVWKHYKVPAVTTLCILASLVIVANIYRPRGNPYILHMVGLF